MMKVSNHTKIWRGIMDNFNGNNNVSNGNPNNFEKSSILLQPLKAWFPILVIGHPPNI